MKKILFIFGTRPEAIKMAPLILEMKKHPQEFQIEVCLTAQHREMLDQVNTFFNIAADYDLDLMKQNQTLTSLTARCLEALDPVLMKSDPDLIFVQGDTTTVLAGSLAAYYRRIPIAHLEAGLRSYKKDSPFPEEINRRVAGQLADFHFAPTEVAVQNLNHEGIVTNVYRVGNTVIDALHLGLSIIHEQGDTAYFQYFDFIDFSKKIILITGHRRESFGEGFEHICEAIKELAEHYPTIEFVYPVHLNPNVQEPTNRVLRGQSNIHLISPLSYPYLLWLMQRSYIVLTDSGGIQEEAPALGKPVLVMRDVTEREEGIKAGTAILVGTKKESIVRNIKNILENHEEYNKMRHAINPYGDGTSSKKICDILIQIYN